MLLYTGPVTPFGRMVEVLTLEAGVALERRVINVYEAGFLDAINPLRLIPTLVLTDGTALYDSRVICRYLALGAPSLMAGDDWAFETRLALVTGIMDAGVALRGESTRPEALRSVAAMATFERRIGKGIAALEADAEAICRPEPRLDRIAAAVLLEYIDYRFDRAWRQDAPLLAEWLLAQSSRPSMLATRFGTG